MVQQAEEVALPDITDTPDPVWVMILLGLFALIWFCIGIVVAKIF